MGLLWYFTTVIPCTQKGMKMKTTAIRVSFRIDDEALARLREQAKKERCSLAEMMKRLVLWYASKEKA